MQECIIIINFIIIIIINFILHVICYTGAFACKRYVLHLCEYHCSVKMFISTLFFLLINNEVIYYTVKSHLTFQYG